MANVGEVDIARFLSNTIDSAHGVIIEPNILSAIRNAQMYNVTTGLVTETTSKSIPFSIFNPNTAKNILIASLRCWWNGATNYSETRITTTSDPGPGLSGAAQLTPLNLKAGGANSLASVYYSQTSVSASGTAFDSAPNTTSTWVEYFGNGTAYLLPANANNGLALFLSTTANSGRYAISCRYWEF